jgi:predicted nucleic acid-binding protein
MILKMQRVIVSDTSCLILLNKINRISLLKAIFGKVIVTNIIAEEFGQILPDFITIEDPSNHKYQQILESFLDKGEASAIALALEKEDCLLIIDEVKGRREAKQLKVKITGTLGILILAKEKKLITSVSEILEQVQHTDFRISKTLLEETKRRSGE